MTNREWLKTLSKEDFENWIDGEKSLERWLNEERVVNFPPITAKEDYSGFSVTTGNGVTNIGSSTFDCIKQLIKKIEQLEVRLERIENNLEICDDEDKKSTCDDPNQYIYSLRW